MSDLTTRIGSVQAGLERLREQTPAIEWQTATLLKLAAELAAIVRQMADAPGESVAAVTAGKSGGGTQDRNAVLARLAWQACRTLPPGVTGEARDAEICRILRAWSVSQGELVALGYARG